ncbi:MAG: 6,7-dimethyl-8-ribityllumazine synthase [Gammaproteobacteria bacterium]|nr:6,7-dimethyl-8-ribityllumazine synthase [Gammaproteobacteria bacterium]
MTKHRQDRCGSEPALDAVRSNPRSERHRVAPGGDYAVVTSRFNEEVTRRLAVGAREALLAAGVEESAIHAFEVDGAWELVPVVAAALESGRFRAVIACGAVIRGETAHFDYICRAATDGLACLQREHRTPVGFALLTTDNIEQALARAGTKGGEAVQAALGAANVIASFQS